MGKDLESKKGMSKGAGKPSQRSEKNTRNVKQRIAEAERGRKRERENTCSLKVKRKAGDFDSKKESAPSYARGKKQQGFPKII